MAVRAEVCSQEQTGRSEPVAVPDGSFTRCLRWKTATNSASLVVQIIASLLANVGAKAAVVTYMEERAARGLRALGVATSADEGASWQLLGLISLLDPPREDTQETVRRANALGVEVSLHARLAWQK